MEQRRYAKGRESIPLEAVEQVELARAFGNHPDELYVHLVNSRRILIARGEPVAMHAAVLSRGRKASGQSSYW